MGVVFVLYLMLGHQILLILGELLEILVIFSLDGVIIVLVC
jgi:hypothetical protein